MNTSLGKHLVFGSILTTEFLVIWLAWGVTLLFNGLNLTGTTGLLEFTLDGTYLHLGWMAPLLIGLSLLGQGHRYRWLFICLLVGSTSVYFMLLGMGSGMIISLTAVTLALAWAGEYCWLSAHTLSDQSTIQWLFNHYLESIASFWGILFTGIILACRMVFV